MASFSKIHHLADQIISIDMPLSDADSREIAEKQSTKTDSGRGRFGSCLALWQSHDLLRNLKILI